MLLLSKLIYPEGFPGGSVVKNASAKVGATRSIPRLERPLEYEIATHSGVLAWELPWREEPGRLQSVGSQKSLTQLTKQ